MSATFFLSPFLSAITLNYKCLTRGDESIHATAEKSRKHSRIVKVKEKLGKASTYNAKANSTQYATNATNNLHVVKLEYFHSISILFILLAACVPQVG